METLPPSHGLTSSATPKAVFWFRVYAGCMAGIYALCALAAPLVFFAGTRAAGEQGMVLKIQAVALLLVGLAFAIAFALVFVFPRKHWAWIYGLVLICIGMTSCCILPAAIPLLIFWLKPEVKSWFNSGASL